MREGEFRIRYHPLFQSDVASSAMWYDQRRIGLGDDFVNCVEAATRDLLEDPYRRSSVDYGLRYWPVHRFPFVVFYDLNLDEILILGVMHTAQEHEAWLRRTR
jgi:hypothetical protein